MRKLFKRVSSKKNISTIAFILVEMLYKLVLERKRRILLLSFFKLMNIVPASLTLCNITPCCYILSIDFPIQRKILLKQRIVLPIVGKPLNQRIIIRFLFVLKITPNPLFSFSTFKIRVTLCFFQPTLNITMKDRIIEKVFNNQFDRRNSLEPLLQTA